MSEPTKTAFNAILFAFYLTAVVLLLFFSIHRYWQHNYMACCIDVFFTCYFFYKKYTLIFSK